MVLVTQTTFLGLSTPPNPNFMLGFQKKLLFLALAASFTFFNFSHQRSPFQDLTALEKLSGVISQVPLGYAGKPMGMGADGPIIASTYYIK